MDPTFSRSCLRLMFVSSHAASLDAVEAWRAASRSVLLRLPGNGAPAVDPLPIQTTSLHDLIPEILEGRIKTLEQAREWFAARPNRSP